MLTDLLPQILFLLGLGFLVANLRAAIELLRWRPAPSAAAAGVAGAASRRTTGSSWPSASCSGCLLAVQGLLCSADSAGASSASS